MWVCVGGRAVWYSGCGCEGIGRKTAKIILVLIICQPMILMSVVLFVSSYSAFP